MSARVDRPPPYKLAPIKTMRAARASSSAWSQWLPRRPAIGTAILLILGILGERLLPPWPGIWVIGAVVCSGIALAIFRRQWLSSAAIAVAIVLAGAASAQLAGFFYPSDDIAQFTRDESRFVHLRLTITDAPRVIGERSAFGSDERNQIARGRVVQVLTRSGWTKAGGTVLLHINPPLSELRIRQTIEAMGMLRRPAVAANPGEFDWAAYSRNDRVLAACWMPGSMIRIISDPGPRWLDRLRAQSRKLLDAGFTKGQSLDHALLRALVLGDSNPELRDVQEDFRRTGTSHHLAISGMHVGVLGGVIYLLCRLLMVSPRGSIVTALSFVMLYGVVVLPSPPVVRAVILCGAFGIGLLSRRTVDGLQLLALTVMAMLIYQPLDLWSAGFELSFGTVCGMILFTRRVERRLFPPDPDQVVVLALLGSAAPLSLRIKLWMRRHCSEAVAAGLVAWLVSMPLILLHFEQLNPWAVAASIILAPFVFAALIAGLLKIILTLLAPPLAGVWAAGAGFCIATMRHVLALLAQLPGSDFPVPSPPIWLVIVLYLLLLVPLIPAIRWKRAGHLAFATAAACILLLPFTTGLSAPLANEQKLTLTTLSVGAGLCNVVELPDGSAVLIDAGSATIRDLQHRIIAPFLRHEAKRGIQCIFLSHRDYDHISAAGDVVENYTTGRVFVSDTFNHFAAQSEPARNLLGLLREHERSPKPLRRGDLVPLGRGAMIEVLWPPENCPFDSNDTGLVLRLTYAGRSILFPADIQADAEEALLHHPEKLSSDILIAPHHGSAERSTPAFLRAVHPRLIISSNDHSLTQKQKWFDRLAKSYPVCRTDCTGAVTVTITQSGTITHSTYLHNR